MKKRTRSDSYESTSPKSKTTGIRRFLSRSPLLFVTLALFALGMGVVIARSGKVEASLPAQSGQGISQSAADQISALVAEKEARTPAQKKLDSQLIYAAKMNRGVEIAPGIRTLETRVTVEADGYTIVDISTNNLKATHTKLDGLKAGVISAVGGNIRANVNISDVETIAGFAEVLFVQPKQEAKLYRTPKSTSARITPPSYVSASMANLSPGFAERAAKVRAQLMAALPTLAAQKGTAPATGTTKGGKPSSVNVVNVSEGDKTHKADVARSSFGVTGAGVKIGVLSDGVSNLAAAQSTGDLGPVTVLPGQTGSGDEGTAMLELVHDLAPGSQLFFATAFTSLTSFAQNVRDLRTAGCDIIIDDVIYFVESPFQDGAPGVTNTNGGGVIQAVADVTAAGAMYFSSAGNEGNINDSTGSVWEGDFVDGGASPVAAITGGTVHNFGSGNLNNQITTAGARALLFWSDPLGASSNDYDLFVLNSAGTAVAASATNIQNGTQDPVEDAGNRTSGQRLVVLKKTGAAARFLHLTCFGAEMAFVTSGTTHGHNQVAAAFSVAATPADDPFCSGFQAGPFPGPFTTANKVECFSSDGPRRIFYNANSTPITPGNVSSTGGVLRQKPDITAADGTAVTGVGGFPNPFFGTSAAAPHAGAIAALVKSAIPAATPAQIRTFLVNSAIDIETAGVDRDSGAGIIMAFEAIQAGGGVPQPVITAAGATITAESCAPANGAIDPGETVTVSLCVQNTGAANTANLVGTLAATGGVTSPSGPQNYGVVVAGGAAVCRNFTFTASGSCGGSVIATLNLQDGATNLGSVTYTFTLGVENTSFTENFDGVTPPSLPAGWTTSFTNGDGDCTIGGASCTLGSNWVTTTSGPDTAPNAVFHNDVACVTDNLLNTPSIAITSASAKLSFRNNFATEASGGSFFDGGVLEISVGGGPFTDILTAGGSFASGGYTGTISTSFLSPIAGRQAWSGNSGGYINTVVNIPAAANGQNVVFRFRMASDCSVGATGWTIDTVKVSNGFLCCGSGGGGGDCVVTCPANVTVANDPNQCGAVVNYPAPTSTGSCGTITCTPPSGSFFPVGTTTVTCSSSGGGSRPSGACSTQTITESTSQTIVPLNSVSCNSPAGHADNSYFRAFSLPSFGINNAFDITSVDIGIEEATAGVARGAGAKGIAKSKKGKSISRPSGGSQPVTINLYTSNTAFPTGFPGSLSLIGTTTIMVADQSGTVLNVPITATAPAGSQLVVEVFTPSGEKVGNFFFIGSNALGQTAPSYILAADCGITTPTDTAAIGFPEMQIVMNVNGCQQAGTGPTCSFTVTVNDTQPPTITCPANVAAVAAPTCPVSNTTTITYPPPTASDNCPGVTVACVPPSGTVFPTGTTTVTCTATDASGNTATCSFTVNVFNVCVQDRSNPNAVLAWNTSTGAYVFCCNGTTFTGVGKVRSLGCTYTLEHVTSADRRVTGKVDFTTFRGEGALQSPIGTVRCTISDNDVRDNNCACIGGPPPASSSTKN